MMFRDPAHAYRPYMDKELDALETKLAHWKESGRDGLPKATHTPAGWLFNRTLEIETANGRMSDLTTDVENLLPILLNTTSAVVRRRTHAALTFVYHASAQSPDIYLRAKLADALAGYAVQKMEVSA